MTAAPRPVEPDLAGRRVLVTGGAGFIGSFLCEALLGHGASVVCVDNEVTGSRRNVGGALDDPRFEYVAHDVTEPLPVDGPVDVVLHLASIASPVFYLRHPVETLRAGSLGTFHALELCRRQAARFVLASTSEVYGDPAVNPQHEEYWGNVNPIGPRSVYDESKRFSEAAVTGCRSAWGIDAGIVRIFNTYGPRMRLDDGRVVPTFIRQALAGEPLTVMGSGTQTRSLCFVDDTVRALVAMAGSAVPGPVNIGNPHEITMRQLADVVLEETGSSSDVTFVDLPQDDPKVRCPDVSRARRLLGWSPTVDLEDGLRRTVAWCRAELAVADLV